MTDATAQSAGGPPNIDPDHVAYVRSELTAIRKVLRLWIAMVNAPVSPWFNGSLVIQKAAIHGVYVDLMMSVRHLLDEGRKNEKGLCSLVSALRAVGAGPVADALRSNDDATHLRLVADKTIAHAKPGDARAPGSHPSGLTGEEFQPAMLARIIHLMSRAFLEHLAPPSERNLDPIQPHHDPIYAHVPTHGLPVVDFVPGTVFPVESDGEAP